MLLVVRLLGPINELLLVIDSVQSAAASLGRIIGITTVADPEAGEPASAADASVRTREIVFRYGDGPRVLDEVSLDIPPGEHLAVVGASGAGKTTLAAVIAGIHRPDSGSVARPDRTALITQEVHVFAGTLRDNFTLAAPTASDRDILTALEATDTAAIVDRLPDGLDTFVGIGGYQVTDAEAQQIALARLRLADPEFAILDEATSEAGSTHARVLDRTAEAALRGRTGLVIAHRLSQAALCHRIVVMERGRIIESGTHGELVAAAGVYAGLWAAWDAARTFGPRL
jgi:ABC-type multidrug transport system fused ATPase/permease subunit